jgi:GntR family transcriptional regulator, arabinose operon transcriptional repressor
VINTCRTLIQAAPGDLGQPNARKDTGILRIVNLERPSKYAELKSILKDAIESGEYKPGDTLPSEHEMSSLYGISRNTIREAIGMLVHEGLLYRVQGKGTFVAAPPVKQLNIALIVVSEDMGSGFLGPILASVSREIRINHATMSLYADQSDVELERASLLAVLADRPDGIILYYIGEEKNIPYVRKVQDTGIPIVFIDRYPEWIETDYVVTDNYIGAYRAVSELISRGYEKVVHFTHNEEASSLRSRREGYKQACLDHGVAYTELIRHVDCPPDFMQIEEAIFQEMSRMLPTIDDRFAVFGATTKEVRGAWRAIQLAGTGSDAVAIACFDHLTIPLPRDLLFVNVVQPLGEMGRRAVQLIVEKAGGNLERQQIALEPEIRIYGGRD